MAAPNQTIRDTFTGSNGPLSANWTSGLYSTSVAAEIVGNAFGGPSGAGFFDAYWDAATFGTVNAEVYATVSTKSATGELMYLVLRAQSPGTAGYDAYTLTLTPSAGTDTIGVVRTVNETDTTITTRSQEVSAGDALALVALGAGATVTLQVWYRASGGSWTQLGADISDTDANRITAAGYIGAGVEGITGRWDDFGGGNHVLGTVEQEGYRWRNDDGSETTATWLASQDTPLTLDVGTSARLRVLLNGTLDPAAAAYQLEYRLSGGSYAAVLAAQPSAPTFQAAGTAVGGTGAVSPAWPTHQAGDIGLLLIESAGGEAATLSTAAGFVAVSGSPQSTGTTTNGTRITVFWARATSSSMATPTVADPGNHVHAIILTFRGCVASGDPWDVTAGATKTPASTSASAPGLTTTVDNTLVVAIIARDTDSAAAAFSAWANSDLTSVTERFDAGTTQGNGGGLGVATGVRAAAGAVGTTTATVSSSINASLTIALRPIVAQPILLAASSNIAASAATATTAQLSAPSGKSTSDFDAGYISDDTNPLPSITITTDDYTEVEWCLTAVSGVAATSDVYEFRVTAGGTALDTYTVTPEWEIGTAGVSVAPDASTAVAATTDPTVVLGAVSVTPAASTAVAATVDPTVSAGGNVTVTPDAAVAVAATANPTTVLGSLSVTPSASTAATATANPTVSLGGVTVAPAASTAVAATPAPTTLLNALVGLRFYGSDPATYNDVDRMRIPLRSAGSPTAADVGAGDFTYEVWVRCAYADNTSTSLTDWRYSNILFDRDAWNSPRGHGLAVARDGSDLVAVFGVAGPSLTHVTIAGTTNIGDGNWWHVAVRRTQSTGLIELLVAGVVEASGTYTTGSLAYDDSDDGGQDNDEIVIGREKHDVGVGFNGTIDAIRVSSARRTLAPERPLLDDADTAVLYWLNEATGTSAADASGNGVTATIQRGGPSNGPAWVVEAGVGTQVSPQPSASVAATVNPTVSIGGLQITPTASSAVATTANPTVVLGSVTVAPSASSMAGATQDPTVVLGALSVAPSASAAAATTADPTVTLGAVSVSPSASAAVATTANPTVSAGGDVVVSPSASAAAITTADPVVVLGPVTIAPAAASARASSADPDVVLGPISITPTSAAARAASADPTVTLGALVIGPAVASITTATIDPTVTGGISASGIVRATLTARRPSVTFTSRKPAPTFASRAPSVTFTAED